MSVSDPAERALIARIAAYSSWAKTQDRASRTAPGRRAMIEKFAREVDPDGVLPPAERERRAEAARKAFYLGMARKSVAARARRRAAQAAPDRVAEAARAAAELRASRAESDAW